MAGTRFVVTEHADIATPRAPVSSQTRPAAKSATVPATATGVVFTLSRLLGSTSQLALVTGSSANLKLDAATGAISATAALGVGGSQKALIREIDGDIAVEYPVLITGVASIVIPVPTPTVSISAAQSKYEGNSGSTSFVYTVTRSTSIGAVSVPWSFSANTTSANDFVGGSYPQGGTVELADGVSSAAFSITVNGDTTVEADETFSVSIALPAGYAAGSATTATGTILNDDVAPSPTVTILAAQSKSEGNSGATVFTYTVTRSASDNAAAVPWSFTAGTTSADDFTGGTYPTGGTVNMAAGVATGTFWISVNGDTVVEGDETFTVFISTPSGYIAGAATSATGTILNDDVAPSPAVTISAAQAKSEGNSGALVFTYTVTRSATDSAVAVPWSFAAGTTSADDFTGGAYPAGGTINMAAGVASGTFSVSVNGDTVVENDETFTVSISTPSGYVAGSATSATGTIMNDDVAPSPTVTISAAQSKSEGNSGATLFTYTVTRSSSSGAIVVPWSFLAGGTGADDYTGGVLPSGGTVNIADGATTGTFAVSVAGDTAIESDETFTVLISTPSGYVAGTATTATGTIVNDDAAGTLAVTNKSLSIPSTAQPGYLLTPIRNVPSAVTPTVTPNDGRFATVNHATHGWCVALANSAISAGTTSLLVAAAGAGSVTVPLTVYTGPTGLPKYPKFPKKTKQLRSLADFASYNTDPLRFAVVSSNDSIDGRGVISMKVNGQYNRTTARFSLGATPWDMRNGVIKLWLKKISAEMTATVNLWSAGTPAAPTANYSSFAYGTGTFAEAYDNGVFCQMGINSARVTATGTGADMSAITHVEVQIGTGDGSAYEAQISDFEFMPNPRTKAAVIFKCADGFADPYTVLRERAKAKGVIAPYFMTPGAVESGSGYDRGFPARMTTDQVNALRLEGTQSGTQAWTTEAAQPDYPSYVTEYTGMREYNKRKGWYADAADDSFHSGVNAGSRDARCAKILTDARTIQRFKNNATKNSLPPMLQSETFPFRDRMSHVVMNVAVLGTGTVTAIAQTMSHIDEAIKINGVAEFAIHGNVAANQNTLDLFDAIIDRYVNVGDFEFHTPASLLDPWLALYGPADPYEFPYSMKAFPTFSAQSPWNSYPDAPVFGTNVIPSGNTPWIEESAYSTTPFYAKASDTPMTVYGSDGGASIDISNQLETGTVTIPRFPAATLPATGSDGHCEIIDYIEGVVHSFFGMKFTNNKWTTAKYAKTSLYGRGFGSVHRPDNARAAGCSTLGGLLTKAEFGATEIKHALAMSLDRNAFVSGYVAPATLEDYTGWSNYGNQAGKSFPMGSLMMLPSTFDVNTIVRPELKVIATALKKYGAYLVDATTGSMNFYAEIGSGWNQSFINGQYDANFGPDMAAIQAALRRVTGYTAMRDRDGVAYTPPALKSMNLVSMRGPWTGEYGSIKDGQYDAPSDLYNIGDTGTDTRILRQVIFTHVEENSHFFDWKGKQAWNLNPELGTAYKVSVFGTGAVQATLTVRHLNSDATYGATLVTTGKLSPGQTFNLTWPNDAGTVTELYIDKAAGAAASIRLELVKAV